MIDVTVDIVMGTTNPSRRSQTARKVEEETPLSAHEEVHGGRDHGNVILANEKPKKHRQKRK